MTTPVSAPSVTSVVITPAGTITPGTLITATVTYVKGTSQTPATQTLTGTATDTATGQAGQLTQTFTVAGTTVQDVTAVTVADTGGRTWTKTGDTGTVATFTATA
jgi:hypothetical protein